MKGGVAMMVSAVLRAASEGTELPRDIVLAVLADEEAGGDVGARFLAQEHAHLFDGVRFALSEFGGFALYAGGRRFYPIQVAEKQISWLKATIRGRGGHGALGIRGGTMARLARFLGDLDRKNLPVHITPVARAFIEGLASVLSRPQRDVFLSLLRPKLTDQVLKLLGAQGRLLAPMLHNTVSATIVRGGGKINVLPSVVEVELDGRALPGFTPDDVMREVHDIVGDDVELELVRHDPGPPEPNFELFDMLSAILRELDPDGIPIPLLQVGVTDARHFAPLGMQTYGFVPLRLPEDFKFLEVVHAADERVPTDALDFGAEAIFRALQRF